VGADASEVMLRAARARSGEVEWRCATAEALPFPDASFDGAMCTLAVHHFTGREAAFRELRRVLGAGPFVLFTCDIERTRRYWLAAYFPRMFERLAAREPSERELLAELSAAGFDSIETEPWHVPRDLVDHFLYCGKERPELYFDPEIRAGISSFASLSEREEVHAGLARLRDDLRSGRFRGVAAAHPTPDGDYLFVRARSRVARSHRRANVGGRRDPRRERPWHRRSTGPSFFERLPGPARPAASYQALWRKTSGEVGELGPAASRSLPRRRLPSPARSMHQEVRYPKEERCASDSDSPPVSSPRSSPAPRYPWAQRSPAPRRPSAGATS
jgi:hypothetical protein